MSEQSEVEQGSGVTPAAQLAEPLDDEEVFYFRSIMGNLRSLREWVLEEQQMVTLASEALGDNIDWLDCWLHRHGLDVDA